MKWQVAVSGHWQNAEICLRRTVEESWWFFLYRMISILWGKPLKQYEQNAWLNTETCLFEERWQLWTSYGRDKSNVINQNNNHQLWLWELFNFWSGKHNQRCSHFLKLSVTGTDCSRVLWSLCPKLVQKNN